ncbi:MAG: hypothetical protein J6P33_05625 [Spirochaetales bacterium]|nr:hypothetical protein [Spirochaetales bacterium]
MSAVAAEIETLKREIERSKAELSQMYLELGEVACSWHKAIGYAPSQETFEKLSDVIAERDDIESRIETLKTAMSEMSEGDKGIEQTRITMKELDKRYAVLISSLGAVAIEIDSAGKLPQRLSKCLEPMREYEKKLGDLEIKFKRFSEKGPKIMASLYEGKIAKARGTLDSVFAETGRRIYNSGNFREVPGERAKAILDEMESIRFAKKNYKNEILDHKSMIDEAQGSLMSLGAYGEENRRLREMKSQRSAILDRLSDVYTEYGQILAQGIPMWMDDQAPEELKRCCNAIIRQSAKLAQLNLSLDHMMMEKDIDIHNLQLSRLSEQMNHLNSQIQAIENQKAELQQKVDAELKAISDLRLRQSEITDKASHLQ